MSLFATQINGKQCSGVPRVKSVAASTSASLASTVDSSSIIISTTTTTSSTTLLTSASSISTSTAAPFNNAIPAVTSPSTTSSTSAIVLLSTSTSSAIVSQSSTAAVVSTSEPSSLAPISSAIVDSASSTALAESPRSSPTTSPQSLSPTASVSTQTSGVISSAPSSGPISTIPDPKDTFGGGAFSTSTIDVTSSTSLSAEAAVTDDAQSLTGHAVSTQTTMAVAGGVVGGVALISLVGLLVWLWRKRMKRHRRSTLLTPLSTGNDNPAGEKGSYIISRNSLGPTTIPVKLRAMVGYNYRRIRGRVNSLVTRSPNPSVDLNRGNSQFGLPETPPGRSSSRATGSRHGGETAKERLVDWWGRLTEDGNFNWKLLRGEPRSEQNDSWTTLPSVRDGKGSQGGLLGPGAQDDSFGNRGASENPRRSRSLGNETFLGSLGINFDTENPFADTNAMGHDSAKIIPLTVSKPNNPFSDANAIPPPSRAANGAAGPATYVQNIRRSRGYSVNAASTRPPSGGTVARMTSAYRESGVSVESIGTRRTRFRSDPFDLDRPELLAQSPGSSTGGVGGSFTESLPDLPRASHQPRESYTSKYSSGVSMGDWSDPGPDVGPGADGRGTPSADSTRGRPSDNPPRGRRQSQGSVGKAM